MAAVEHRTGRPVSYTHLDVYKRQGYNETVTKAEIEDAFVKGRLVIVEGANYLVPVAFGATGVITVVAGETVKTQAWAASAEK